MQCACACTREIFFFGGCVGLRERGEKLAAATRLHRRPDVEWQRQLQRHSPAAKKKYSRALSLIFNPQIPIQLGSYVGCISVDSDAYLWILMEGVGERDLPTSRPVLHKPFPLTLGRQSRKVSVRGRSR
jgi:hypothetical protein